MSNLAVDQLSLIEQRVANEKKSTGVAYVLWFFFGWIGIHNFYLGRVFEGAVQIGSLFLGWWLVVFGAASHSDIIALGVLCLVLWGGSLVVDLFTIPKNVADHRDLVRQKMIAEMHGAGYVQEQRSTEIEPKRDRDRNQI